MYYVRMYVYCLVLEGNNQQKYALPHTRSPLSYQASRICYIRIEELRRRGLRQTKQMRRYLNRLCLHYLKFIVFIIDQNSKSFVFLASLFNTDSYSSLIFF